MRLSAGDMAQLAEEVQETCIGGQVQRIFDGRPGEVLIHLRQPGASFLVLLAAGTPMARIHLATVEPAHPSSPGPFVFLLRKHLVGTRLRQVEAPPGDRVVILHFAHHWVQEDGIAQSIRFRLVGELTGRHGNLFLLDEAATILGSLRPNVSYRRKLVAGEPYVPPARPDQLVIDTISRWAQQPVESPSREVERQCERQLAQQDTTERTTALLRSLKQAHRRLDRRLHHVAEDLARADRAEDLIRWGQLLQSAYGKITRGAAQARVPDYFDPHLRPVEIPLDPALPLGDNIARYFKEGRRLGKAKERIRRRMEETRVLVERVERAIGALQASAPPEVPVISGEGAVAAQREPAELPKEGAIGREEEPAGPPEEDVIGEAEQLPGPAKPEAIEPETLLAELSGLGLIPAKPDLGRRRGPDRPFSPPYLEYYSADGNPILVGRGARHNDQLTFRVARGHDLWLHAAGTSGAHVIVCLGKTEELKPETLVDAATLAIHHSGLKGENVAEVRYTWQRNVRKIKGSPAGQVTVAQSKVMAVRREPERLARLLASRKREVEG
ncbi:MAG: NFACT family protein [Bradymonadales bacterium]|nr:NFACT family protein [Bradymonadales bacterium]